MNSMISIIVPVYNEEYVLTRKRLYFLELAEEAELIFVDGGSTDQTVELASEMGTVIVSPKGRALQMNQGALKASHDILLFLHADTSIPLSALRHIQQAISEKNFLGGCFRQVFMSPEWIYRWIAWTGNARAKIFRVFYGDQGIFVRRGIFRDLKGFPNVPIGEDMLFTKRLRRKGRVGILPNPIYCSTRRFEKQGILRTNFLNWAITFATLFRGNSRQLSKHYQDIR